MTAATGVTASAPAGLAGATPAAADPYSTRSGARGWLARLNPLATLAATVPAMIGLMFVRDLAAPLIFIAIAYALVLTGVRLSPRALALLLLGLPVGVAVLSLGMAVWTDPARIDQTVTVAQIGEWRLYGGALLSGLATGLRLGAIVALSLVAGLSTTGPDLVRAAVQHLRVPYRVGYTALAAFRFVPRFAHELELIRGAHRVRGAHGGRGPFAAIARWAGYIVPLLAGAIRHAERVALAMDARAFGAYPDRTERYILPWRRRDTVFVVGFWLTSAAIFVVFIVWPL